MTPGPVWRLPCGQVLADLVDQVADGRPAPDGTHQQSCPFCRQALADVTRWWAPVRALAGERVSAPPGLLSTVMVRIRPSGSVGVSVADQGQGVTSVSLWALAGLASRAAAAIPGVAAVVGWTARALSGEGAPAVPPGQGVAVDVDMVVTGAAQIPTLARAVRRRVARDLWALGGVRATEINVSVEDVAIPPTTGAAAS